MIRKCDECQKSISEVGKLMRTYIKGGASGMLCKKCRKEFNSNNRWRALRG